MSFELCPQAAPPNNTAAGAGTNANAPSSNAATALVGSYVLNGAHVVTIDEALRAEGVASLTYIRGADAYGQAGGPADPEDLPAAVALAKESTSPACRFRSSSHWESAETCFFAGVGTLAKRNGFIIGWSVAVAGDVAILVLGDDERMCGEWQDRDSLDLGGGQLALLEAVSAVAQKTIVVLVHGRPQTFGDNTVLNQVRKTLLQTHLLTKYSIAEVRVVHCVLI